MLVQTNNLVIQNCSIDKVQLINQGSFLFYAINIQEKMYISNSIISNIEFPINSFSAAITINDVKLLILINN